MSPADLTADAPIPAPTSWSRTPEVAAAATVCARDAARASLIQLLATKHAGRANGIGAEALANALSTSERMVRSLVSEAREAGLAISATPETGYYVAETAEELAESCEFLRSRAMHSLRIEAQLRRIPFPDLLGQLRLPT